MVRDLIVFGTSSSKVREILINEGQKLTGQSYPDYPELRILSRTIEIYVAHSLSSRSVQAVVKPQVPVW